MASIDYGQPADDATQRTMGRVQPEVADLVGIFRRGWFIIFVGAVIGALCAAVMVSTIPPVYKANSRIAFDRSLIRYLQTNKVTNEPVIDDADTWGQIYVISSESILLSVVRSLGLANDPEFIGEKEPKSVTARVRGLIRNAAFALGFPEQSSEAQPGTSQADPEKIAFDHVVRNLSVSREDVPSVINVAFASRDPVKAATIANAIVDTYMNASIANKVKSTNVAGKVVQERVEELKRQAKDAERALLEYKMANNLIGSAKTTLTGEELTALQNHLTNARIAMAEARARMERAASSAEENALFTPDNELITRLRAQLLDLTTRLNDIEGRVGKDHLAAVKLRNRIDEVRDAIASEQKRISGSFSKEYELARARYDELSATIAKVMGEEGANSEVKGRMRELETAAETLRGLYNRMLQQLSEMHKFEVQPTIAPDARILKRAAPPMQTESAKKRLVILAGGSMLGLLLGAAFVLARNFPFGVFRTCQQVTSATGLPCAVLPSLSGSKDRAALEAGLYALEAPFSRYAQTLRSMWATISLAQRESGAKVVGVLSSVPGEGKTTVLTNLAAHFARHATIRVLMIDADFHRQSLTKRVAPEATEGLREALAAPNSLSKFVVRNDELKLDVLPCPGADRVPNAAELLGSPQMEQVIAAAREAYDLVLVEAPPMAVVVDYKMIARHCDAFVFVIEWGKTSQRVVLESLAEGAPLLDRLLCVVLNKADPSALRSIEHYKGDRYQNYYSDRKVA